MKIVDIAVKKVYLVTGKVSTFALAFGKQGLLGLCGLGV